MFKDPTLNKNKKEEDNTKKWKRFSVSLNRWFELDDVSDMKIIEMLVLKLLMSLRGIWSNFSITGIWCIAAKLLNYLVF